MIRKPLRSISQRVKAPVERFLHTESASSMILLAAAGLALIWANSPWASSYEHLWHWELTFGFGQWSITESLHFWINDFLMTIFFMVVGFEVKREIVEGELADMRRATLPIVAAIGGMVIPALVYVALNPSGPSSGGWGVPMATDIAFALGVLGLLGKRVPAALRVLLLALAIIDDIGAILVIAFFYSSNLDPQALLTIAVGLAVLFGMLQAGVRPGGIYCLPLVILWAGVYSFGVHPTVAGVIVGLCMPVKPWLSKEQFVELADEALAEFHKRTHGNYRHEDILQPLRRLSLAGREAGSPVVKAINTFHPWVAFAIMPLFALANAGVNFNGLDTTSMGAATAAAGIILGLAVGKPLGILSLTWMAVRLGWCKLPRGVTWGGITVLGFVAGIGFTMAIFIAELAFRGNELLPIAKVAILVASTMGGIMALTMGQLILADTLDPIVAKLTAADVEVSNEA